MALEDRRAWDNQIIWLLSIKLHLKEHVLKIPKMAVCVTFISVNYGDPDQSKEH